MHSTILTPISADSPPGTSSDTRSSARRDSAVFLLPRDKCGLTIARNMHPAGHCTAMSRKGCSHTAKAPACGGRHPVCQTALHSVKVTEENEQPANNQKNSQQNARISARCQPRIHMSIRFNGSGGGSLNSVADTSLFSKKTPISIPKGLQISHLNRCSELPKWTASHRQQSQRIATLQRDHVSAR